MERLPTVVARINNTEMVTVLHEGVWNAIFETLTDGLGGIRFIRLDSLASVLIECLNLIRLHRTTVESHVVDAAGEMSVEAAVIIITMIPDCLRESVAGGKTTVFAS